MPRLTVTLLSTTTAAFWLGAACALPAEPLFDPDSGPLTGLFGWPTSSEGSRLTPGGQNDWRLHGSITSHSVSETGDDASLILDGETTHLWLDWRRGFSERLEVGIMVPWIRHAPGHLDSVIREWHDLFGLPQGNRSAWPEDRLLFEYQQQGREEVRLDRSAQGIGDLRIHAGWILRDRPGSGLALRLGLKLPTGNSGELLGSGAADLSIGLAGDVDSLWNREALSGFYRISALWFGTPDVLPANARQFAGQLAAGLEYRFTPGFALAAQTILRSAPFDVAVDPLGDWGMSLGVGARFGLPGDWQLQLGFIEDVKVESYPDIGFLATVSAPVH